MKKPNSVSFRLVALCALAAFPLPSTALAQETIAEAVVEEAVEATSDAVAAIDSRLTAERKKQREERKAAYNAAFDFAPKPALWKITKAQSTVYIFGSMRNLPQKLRWQSEAFTKTLFSADRIYFETPYIARSSRNERRQDERKSFRKLMRHDRDLVEERFDPGLFDQIKDGLKSDFLVVGDFMPTWLLVTLVADTDRRFQPGRGYRYMDYKIRQTVTDRDVTVDGLEESSHLIDVLNKVSEKKQRKWLNDFVRAEVSVDKKERYRARKRNDGAKNGLLSKREQQAITWAKGEPLEQELAKPTGYSDFAQYIRDDRLKNWPKKIDAILEEEGSALVIVDQEYLYGDNNLRSALERKGYSLERVQ